MATRRIIASGAPWEAIVGYSFPQEDWQLEREGSAMVGFGLELLFGGDPF